MKNKSIALFCCIISFFTLTITIVSCDSADSTSKGTIQGIYTVSGNSLRPELTDTFYTVKNLQDFGLRNGNRAILTLRYDIDNTLGAKLAKWQIKSVEEILPVLLPTSKENVDESIYSSAITGIGPMPKYGAYWLWRNYQNIYIGYYSNGTNGDFKLSPIGLSKDTLCFTLNSKITAGGKPMKQLLSFDISSAISMLSTEEISNFSKLDSIYTKITTKVELLDQDTIKTMSITGGKYKKTF